MRPSLRAVLLDYGGTIDSDGLPWPKRFIALYKEAGVEASEERILRAFYDCDDALPARLRGSAAGLEETVRLQVEGTVANLRAAGAAVPADAAGRVAGRFLDETRATLRRNRAVLERIRLRYPLGIVSNFYGNLEAVLASEGLRDLFGAVAESERLGFMKPDPRLFRAAAEGLGVRPEECLMAGDSVPRDMKGASELGMRLAWLSGGRPLSALEGLDASALQSLSELEPLLDRVEVGA